jgi:hypothetical protein
VVPVARRRAPHVAHRDVDPLRAKRLARDDLDGGGVLHQEQSHDENPQGGQDPAFLYPEFVTLT